MNKFCTLKNNHYLALLSQTLIMASLLFASSLRAEEEKKERLYQIEIIVFERSIKLEGADLERWPKNLNLEYPSNRKTLLDPEKEANNTTEGGQHDTKNTMGLSQEFLQSLEQQSAKSKPASLANITIDNASESKQEPSTLSSKHADLSSQPAPVKLLEFLDDSNKILIEQRKALGRTRGLRTVFHQTWIQSLVAPKDAPSLIIQGGNQFGEHYELEGTINLSVNRYLHIQTDLWLTSFVPNYGQQSEHWPNLPSQQKQYFWSTSEPTTKSATNGPSINLNFSSETQNTINTSYSMQSVSAHTTSNSESQYIIKEIITLRQNRKMKSKELHYIDHPRMGLLIKVLPYVAEETETI